MTTGLVLQCISFHPSENYTVKICVPISCYINMMQDTGQKVFLPPLPSLIPLLLYMANEKSLGLATSDQKWRTRRQQVAR